MTPGELLEILKGKLPEASKQELRMAAKRINDRKQYAEKTQLNWTKDAPSDNDRLRDFLQSRIQFDEAND
jgi:hypothetical protein